MALRIRFQFPSKCELGYSVERLSDGLLLDHGDGTFKAAPDGLIAPLPEDTAPFAGRYKATLDKTPWPDGDYCVSVHHLVEDHAVVAELAATLVNGDDATPLAPRLVKVTTVSLGGVTFDLYGVPAPSPAPKAS